MRQADLSSFRFIRCLLLHAYFDRTHGEIATLTPLLARVRFVCSSLTQLYRGDPSLCTSRCREAGKCVLAEPRCMRWCGNGCHRFSPSHHWFWSSGVLHNFLPEPLNAEHGFHRATGPFVDMQCYRRWQSSRRCSYGAFETAFIVVFEAIVALLRRCSLAYRRGGSGLLRRTRSTRVAASVVWGRSPRRRGSRGTRRCDVSACTEQEAVL